MADDFNDWIDGEPITGPSSDGSFTEWIDGEPVIRYEDSATLLVIPDATHLHDADNLTITTTTFYITDFSDQTIGLAPTDWTEEYVTTNGELVIVSDAYIGSKAMHVNGTSYAVYVASWDDVPDLTDVEVLVLAKPDVESSIHNFGVVVRGSGSSGSENNYLLRTYHNDRTYLNKFVSGAFTQLNYDETDSPALYDDTSYYWFRFSVIGTALKAKVWKYGDEEPAAWLVEDTDSDISGSGFVGVHTRGGTFTDPIVAWIGVSSDGTTVPMPDLPTNLVVAACDHLHDADNLTVVIPSISWRFQFARNDGDVDYLSIREVELRGSVGGADQCSGGTADASSEHSVPYFPINAFDDDTGTKWVAEAYVTEGWLGYIFASAVDVAQYSIDPDATDYPRAPNSWMLERYDIGLSDWVPVDARINETGWSGARTYEPSTPAYGTLWRLNISAVGTTGTLAVIQEMEMRESVGGADVCTVANGFAYADSVYNDNFAITGYDASKAFDGNSLYYASKTTPCQIYYCFSSEKEITQYTIKARSSGNLDTAPKAWTLEKWTGSAWEVVDTQSDQTGWSYDEIRTFTPGTVTLTIPDAYHLHDADQADAFIGIVVWSGTHADAGTATMRSYRGAMVDTDISDPGITVTKIRVRYADTTVFTYGITGASIGLRDGTTSDYQTDKFTRLTFNGGSNTVTVGAGGGDKWSDWVDIDWFDDDTYTFVHTDLADVGGTFGIAYSSSGYTYRKDGTYSDAMVADISGYTLTGAFKYGYNRVEVAGVPSTDVNLVIPDAAHLHDADVLALTQAHDLTVAEAYNELVDEGPITIQTGLTLAIAESYHDLVDEGPLALIQEHALVVAECDHLHEADGIILTALHILTVAECYHVHAPPNLTLILPLTVQESHHLHDSDNITLSADVSLTNLDSYHVLNDDFDHLLSPDRTLVLLENGAASSGGIGYSAGTYRMPFSVAAAFPQHQKIRFQISADSTHSTSTLVSASYGYRASGDTTTDTPTALTFPGISLPYTIPAGETFWSDWFDFSPGTASEILVSLWLDDTHYPGYWSDGNTRYWGGSGSDQTLAINMSTFLTQSNTWYIRSIEVTNGELSVDDGAHVTTSDNIDFNQHFLYVNESKHSIKSQLGLATPLAVDDAAHLHTADHLALTVPLTVADAHHLHEADAIPALTGTHNLTLAACDHLHDADALTLTQDHALALDDADHLHEADTLNLAGTNILVVAEAYHAHAADSADLIVILGVDETYHEHTAPNLTIVSGFDLVIPESVILTESDNLDLVVGLTVVECFHDHLAENLALTQLHILTVQESYHLLVSEVPNPNMTGDLAMQNAWHAIVSDEIVLTGEHTLVIREAYHRLVSDPVNLAQEHTLEIVDDGAYHLHTADNITLPVITAGLERTFIESLTVDRAFRTRTTDLEILTLTRPINDTVLTSYLGVTTKHELASLTQVRTILRV